jgi:uncharacterized protein YukE
MKLSIVTVALSLCSSVALAAPTSPPTNPIRGGFKRQVGFEQIAQLGTQIAQTRVELSNLINNLNSNARSIIDGIAGDTAGSLNNGLNQANQGVAEAVQGLASMGDTIQSVTQAFQGVEGGVSGNFIS